MTKTQKILIHLALVSFGLIAGLITIEIALRIMHHFKKGSEFNSIADLRGSIAKGNVKGGPISLADIVTPNADDRIIYELRPNLSLRFQRADVRTNSLGMRGPEYPVVKPKATVRIALLGDSFAFGWGVEEHEAFASVLERNLNRLSSDGRKYEVLNLAVPGYSTFQEVALFEEKGLCMNPDAVLLYFVQNDFGLPFFVRDVRADTSGGFFSALEFSRLGWQAKQEELVKMQGWDPSTSLNRLLDITEKAAIPFFLAINPKKSQKKDLARLGNVRKRNGFHLIELREGLLRAMETRGIEAKQLTLSFDPHPSPLRHGILGDLMTPYFLALEDFPR